MLSVVIAIHLMLVIALICVVLLQKSEGGGLVSSSSGFLTGRGTANVLSRTTAILAAGFFVTSLALSLIAGYEHHPATVIPASSTAPAGPQAPSPGGSPAAPLSTGGGLLNQMEKGFPSLPAGSNPNFKPEAPSGPQVPQSK
ncbi:MAG TPA: preprotein translocase subunit SecG [Xanthobacteraceae bacterium]|nr:preprotein translocase subunit SecG [Xanthobacteraceae bacterium]